MIHDLLLALNGCPGDLFCESVQPNGHVTLALRCTGTDVVNFFPDSLGFADDLVKNSICTIASYICRIRRFVSLQQEKSTSIYDFQLAIALESFLRDAYEPILKEMEKNYLSSPSSVITPLSIAAELGKYTDALRTFVAIIDGVTHGVPLLNAAWNAYCKIDTGVVSLSTKTVERFIRVLVIPFLNQLEEWLCHGFVKVDRDPYKEFFIECIDRKTNQYELRLEKRPPFVDVSLCHKILAVGDLRRELAKSDRTRFAILKDLANTADLETKSESIVSLGDLLPRVISAAVTEAHQRANKEMAAQLMSAGALSLISRCCELSLMTKGELFSTWFNSPTVSNILRSTSTENLDKFATVLAGELRIAAQRLYTTSKHDAINVALDTTRFELEFRQATHTVFPAVSVYLFPVANIPSGLTRVLSTEAVKQYKHCFNYLVFLRLTSSALNNNWRQLVTSRRSIKGRHQQAWVNETRTEFARMARMSRVLLALEEHAFHVICSQRQDFLKIANVLEKLILENDSKSDNFSNKQHDCDTFIMAHAKMISRISHELIQPNQNYQLRTSLISCVLKSLPFGSNSLFTVPSEFDNIAALLNLLLNQQTLIVGSTNVLPLHSLLLSMDFNDFYSKQQ